MKLTENTKVRVRVPKHLYEAIQAELDKKDEMKESEETMEEADAQQASVEEIAAAMDKAVTFAKKLAQQIADKKGGNLTQKDFFRLIDNFRSKVKSFGPFKSATGTEEMNEESGEVNEYVGLNPADYDMTTLMGLGLPILTALLSVAQQKLGPKVASAIKSAIAKKKGGEEKPTEEMEETLDLESLMEAVKDASKKKAAKKIADKKVEDDKKKKEAKIVADKKVEDDKKKKEAEAKKKAVAAKKK